MRLHTLLAFAIALAVATPARADVAYSVAAFFVPDAGPASYQVEVRITSARAESVVVPVGTVLSAENEALQKLVVGEEVRVDMAEGQTRVFVVHAYCMHEHRRGPFERTPLRRARVVRDAGLLGILAADVGPGERQARVWAYLTRRRLRALGLAT